jgi:glycosyltransferase involved in cell wall biosynthesis
VGQIASHARYKGFDEGIDAMLELPRRFPNLKYTIVSDGDFSFVKVSLWMQFQPW